MHVVQNSNLEKDGNGGTQCVQENKSDLLDSGDKVEIKQALFYHLSL